MRKKVVTKNISDMLKLIAIVQYIKQRSVHLNNFDLIRNEITVWRETNECKSANNT